MDIIADLVIGEIEMMGLLLLNAVRQQLAQTMHEEMATFRRAANSQKQRPSNKC